MTAIEALLLGVLEGATEFLPISSTGHLILARHLLGIPETAFTTSFLIVVQLGAILAVLAVYWRSFLDVEVLKRLFAAFLPTAVVGFLLYNLIKGYLLNNELVVVIALLVGGALLLLLEYFHREARSNEGIDSLSYRHAIMVGLFQSLAIVPGVSRSAATIGGGLLLGLRRAAIVEFSFLLAVPTMLAATSYDLLKTYDTFDASNLSLMLLGAGSAFVIALLAVRFFLAYVKRHTFTPFALYRIFLALLFLTFVL